MDNGLIFPYPCVGSDESAVLTTQNRSINGIPAGSSRKRRGDAVAAMYQSVVTLVGKAGRETMKPSPSLILER